MKKRLLSLAALLVVVLLFASCFNLMSGPKSKTIHAHLHMPGRAAREAYGYYGPDSLEYCVIRVEKGDELLYDLRASLDQEVVVEVMDGIEYTFTAYAFNNEEVLIASCSTKQTFDWSDENPVVKMEFKPHPYQCIELNLLPYANELQNTTVLYIERKLEGADDSEYRDIIQYNCEPNPVDCHVRIPDYFTEAGKRYTYRLTDGSGNAYATFTRTADNGYGELFIESGSATLSDDTLTFTEFPHYSCDPTTVFPDAIVDQIRIQYLRDDNQNWLAFEESELNADHKVSLTEHIFNSGYTTSGTYNAQYISGSVYLPGASMSGYVTYICDTQISSETSQLPSSITIGDFFSINLQDYEDDLADCSVLEVMRKPAGAADTAWEYAIRYEYCPEGSLYTYITLKDLFVTKGSSYNYMIKAYPNSGNDLVEIYFRDNNGQDIAYTAGLGFGEITIDPGTYSYTKGNDYIQFTELPSSNFEGFGEMSIIALQFMNENGEIGDLYKEQIPSDGKVPLDSIAAEYQGTSYCRAIFGIVSPWYEYDLVYLKCVTPSEDVYPEITFNGGPDPQTVISVDNYVAFYLNDYADKLSDCSQINLYRDGKVILVYEDTMGSALNRAVSLDIILTDYYTEPEKTYKYSLWGRKLSGTSSDPFDIGYYKPSKGDGELEITPGNLTFDPDTYKLEVDYNYYISEDSLQSLGDFRFYYSNNLTLHLSEFEEGYIDLTSYQSRVSYAGQTLTPDSVDFFFLDSRLNQSLGNCYIGTITNLTGTPAQLGLPVITFPAEGGGVDPYEGYISFDLSDESLNIDDAYDIWVFRSEAGSSIFLPVMNYTSGNSSQPVNRNVTLVDYYTIADKTYTYKINITTTNEEYDEIPLGNRTATKGKGEITFSPGKAEFTHRYQVGGLQFSQRPFFSLDGDYPFSAYILFGYDYFEGKLKLDNIDDSGWWSIEDFINDNAGYYPEGQTLTAVYYELDFKPTEISGLTYMAITPVGANDIDSITFPAGQVVNNAYFELSRYDDDLYGYDSVEIWRKPFVADDNEYEKIIVYTALNNPSDLLNEFIYDNYTKPGNAYDYKIMAFDSKSEVAPVFIDQKTFTTTAGYGEVEIIPGTAQFTFNEPWGLQFNSMPSVSIVDMQTPGNLCIQFADGDDNIIAAISDYQIDSTTHFLNVDRFFTLDGSEKSSLAGKSVHAVNYVLTYDTSNSSMTRQYYKNQPINDNSIDPVSFPSDFGGGGSGTNFITFTNADFTDGNGNYLLRDANSFKIFRTNLSLPSASPEVVIKYEMIDPASSFGDGGLTLTDPFVQAGRQYEYKLEYQTPSGATGTQLIGTRTAAAGYGEISINPGEATFNDQQNALFVSSMPYVIGISDNEQLDMLHENGKINIVFTSGDGTKSARLGLGTAAGPISLDTISNRDELSGLTLDPSYYEFELGNVTEDVIITFCRQQTITSGIASITFPGGGGSGGGYATFELNPYLMQLSNCTSLEIHRKRAEDVDYKVVMTYSSTNGTQIYAQDVILTDFYTMPNQTYNYKLVAYDSYRASTIISETTITPSKGSGEIEISSVEVSHSKGDSALTVSKVPNISPEVPQTDKALYLWLSDGGHSAMFNMYEVVDGSLPLTKAINRSNGGESLDGMSLYPDRLEFVCSEQSNGCLVTWRMERLLNNSFDTYGYVTFPAGGGGNTGGADGYISINLAEYATALQGCTYVNVLRRSSDSEPDAVVMQYCSTNGSPVNLDVTLVDYFSKPDITYQYTLTYNDGKVNAGQRMGTMGDGMLYITSTGTAGFQPASNTLYFNTMPDVAPHDLLNQGEFTLHYTNNENTLYAMFNLADIGNDNLLHLENVKNASGGSISEFAGKTLQPESLTFAISMPNAPANSVIMYMTNNEVNTSAYDPITFPADFGGGSSGGDTGDFISFKLSDFMGESEIDNINPLKIIKVQRRLK